MRWIRMIVTLSGGGPGGRDWRDHPAGSPPFEVEDWEAEDLIRIGLAVAAPEGGEEPPQLAPMPHDIKQRWVDYAISQGEDPDIAPNMTKADLMSKYGGRL